jgi:hypothetical protein
MQPSRIAEVRAGQAVELTQERTAALEHGSDGADKFWRNLEWAERRARLGNAARQGGSGLTRSVGKRSLRAGAVWICQSHNVL